jgi:drug/metabolite transporter (DMT)-like permease
MDKRPGNLIGAVVLIFIQVVLNAFVGVLGVVDISDRQDHGQDVTAAHYLLGYGSLVVALVLGVSAVLLLRRLGAARIPIAVLEGLNVLGGLFALVMGTPTAVVGIVIAVIVLAMVFGRQTSDWLSVR